jgi:NAD(P)-dependent dehydrogenase (short-subunit alcohol dehydrogenase family)
VPRPLDDAVVVITGARRGSRLVLAARGEQALGETAQECARLGAQAIAVPTDVRDEIAVSRLADSAAERFGRIDVWMNNAGVIAYGRFEQLPSDVFRAVIETNLLGQVHGSRAALPYFRSQQQGVLINMSSVWGRVTSPDVSAYVASKFAVRAFSECLRQELTDSPGIDVAIVLPQAVDTPIFAHAANYSGRRARPVPPLVDPEIIADGILQCAESPANEITYSRLGRVLEALHSLLPSVYQRVIPAAFAAGNYAEGSAMPGPGNLLAPIGVHEISGRWRSEHRRQLSKALLASATAGIRGLFKRRI